MTTDKCAATIAEEKHGDRVNASLGIDFPCLCAHLRNDVDSQRHTVSGKCLLLQIDTPFLYDYHLMKQRRKHSLILPSKGILHVQLCSLQFDTLYSKTTQLIGNT